MRGIRLALGGAIAISLGAGAAAVAQESGTNVGEIVVTAQKREQDINDVGMSVSAATGAQLQDMGITEPSQLDKLVPGFSFNQSYYGTPIYTIRGVGFQDTSLAASPTVSVYVDEVPLPYSIMTAGASLDLERVEVLKGPQGTLFGSNATGGAINYIAAKPTDEFEAGFDVSYGRFETFDVQGFISGPIINNDFRARVALRHVDSGPWQEAYTHNAEWGRQDMFQGRAALVWEPTDTFSANLTLSGFIDQGDSQMPQLIGIARLSPTNTLASIDPRIGIEPFNQFANTGSGYHYPFAPEDAQAFDGNTCINNSAINPPFQPTAPGSYPGQPQGGGTYPYGGNPPIQGELCSPATKDTTLFVASLRMDWEFNGMTLTSLTAYEDFNRNQFIEGDGMIFQDYENWQQGQIQTVYQELRLAGDWGSRGGSWVVGANYEEDETADRFLQSYNGSTAIPPAGLYLGPTAPTNNQTTETVAVFASADFPLTDTLLLQGGLRWTETDKSFTGCGFDGGDGSWAFFSYFIQTVLLGGPGVNPGNYGCGTVGPADQAVPFAPDPDGYDSTLVEDNVSWRVGLNWSPNDDMLLYGNVSRGYKAGVYPTVASAQSIQLEPTTQEELLAYEIGVKSTLFDDTLQLNAAAFYYDYTDKQLLGAVKDIVFGPLPRFVNVPESHVMGFELSGIWQPISGLRISPTLSYSKSEVDGCEGEAPAGESGCHDGNFTTWSAFGQVINITGQAFPASPEWQAAIDAQYTWQIGEGLDMYVGGNVNYHDETPGFFFNTNPPNDYFGVPSATSAIDPPPNALNIDAYTLLDLRAGIESEHWSFQAWGRNVTDEYYWHSAAHVNDVLVRYAGMPATYGITIGYRY